MHSKEIVKRAIEFRNPPRLPFWQFDVAGVPDDVFEIREMDRARAGWFFDHPVLDDWGCRWARTEHPNMGQVVEHPLADWSRFARYRPPDPRDAYYFERLGPLLEQAGGRYVAVTCHFNLIERLHMLRGFMEMMNDFLEHPDRIEALLSMILEFKLEQIDELYTRFGKAIDGLFLTDDWATQRQTFVGPQLFNVHFSHRYAALFEAIHGCGWHAILHSCGRVNDFVPRFIELGVDVLNLQQPRAYGLVEFGRQFRGKVCFLTTVDIQTTLYRGLEAEVREEARLLVENWSTPAGGLIIFNYGDSTALGLRPAVKDVMFGEFAKLQNYWSAQEGS